jgi:hypothetical protein
MPESEPFAAITPSVTSASILTVIVPGREFADQYLIKHEFIKPRPKATAMNV